MMCKSKVFLHWWNSRKHGVGEKGCREIARNKMLRSSIQKSYFFSQITKSFMGKMSWFGKEEEAAPPDNNNNNNKKKSPSQILNSITPRETWLVLCWVKTFSWNSETSNPGTGTRAWADASKCLSFYWLSKCISAESSSEASHFNEMWNTKINSWLNW